MKILEAAKNGWEKGVGKAKEKYAELRKSTIAEKTAEKFKKFKRKKTTDSKPAKPKKEKKTSWFEKLKKKKNSWFKKPKKANTPKKTTPPKPTSPKPTYSSLKTTGELNEVVKVVEPTSGSKVTFQIFMNQPNLKSCVDQIIAIARVLNSTCVVNGDKVTVSCPSPEVAERIKNYWK